MLTTLGHWSRTAWAETLNLPALPAPTLYLALSDSLGGIGLPVDGMV